MYLRILLVILVTIHSVHARNSRRVGSGHFRVNEMPDNGYSDTELESYYAGVRQDATLPRQSFLQLVDNREKQAQQKQRIKGRRNQLDTLPDPENFGDQPLAGLQGRPGPPGPPGPQGPPGAIIAEEKLIELLNRRLEEEKARRSELILTGCPMCKRRNETNNALEVGILDLIPHVTSAFFQVTSDAFRVEKKSAVEVTMYTQPDAIGTFNRGSSFDQSNGRFFAPLSGIYSLHASFQVQGRIGKATQIKRWENPVYLKILICIDAMCNENAVMSATGCLKNNKEIVTLNISGMLYIKEEQYVSVYINNTSRRYINILPGSMFQGVLLGT